MEKYQRLNSIGTNLYQTGSPIIIEAGVLLFDTVSNITLAQLKFRGIAKETITALQITLRTFDVGGVELKPVENFQYLDLNVNNGDIFGSRVPIYLPEANTRSYTIGKVTVFFKNGEQWESRGKWEELPLPGGKSETPEGDIAAVVSEYEASLLERKREAERIAKEKRDHKIKKIRKISICFGSIAVIVPIVTLLYIYVFSPMIIYHKAASLMNDKKFNEAITVFESLGSYRDCTDMIDQCHDLILEENYQAATELLEAKEYTEAIIAFEALGSYKDSKELLTTAQNHIDYDQALSDYEAGNYETALSVFYKLKDFQDSADKYMEVGRAYADNLYEAKDYINAIKYYEQFDKKEANYQDACYQYASTLMEEKDYSSAITYLKKITGYKDADTLQSEAQKQSDYMELYKEALAKIDENQYTDAVALLNQLPSDYEDVKACISFCNKYKFVVGKWKCTGYDSSGAGWITDPDLCKKQDMTITVSYPSEQIIITDYYGKEKYAELNGTRLTWPSGFDITFNTSTGVLSYYDDKGVLNKENFIKE